MTSTSGPHRQPGLRFPNGELERSVTLSAVTDRSVRVWLRAPAGEAQAVALAVDGRVAAEATLQPDPDHDGVAAADLVLDAPAPNAAFAVRVGDTVRHGRLAPTPGAPTAFTFAFGSCHQPFTPWRPGALATHPGAGIYPALGRVLRAHQGRFLALLGDQIYSGAVAAPVWKGLRRGRRPPSDATLHAVYRHLYRGYFNEPGFRALVEEWPTCWMWDDNDIFDSWGSLLHLDDFDRRRWRAADQVYRAYQHLRNPGATLADAPPYHYHFWYGDVGFFVLDVRGARDYRNHVLLGERQWRDLEAFLEQASARAVPTLFVGCTVPIVHFSPALLRLLELRRDKWGNGARDRWSSVGFHAERDALLDRLFAWQSAGPNRQVILLCGDVHTGAVFRIRRRHAPGLLHEWTSSPLSTPITPAQHLANLVGTSLVAWGEWRYAVARQALVPRNNFGLVGVTPRASGGHHVALTLYAYSRRRRVLRPTARAVAQPAVARPSNRSSVPRP